MPPRPARAAARDAAARGRDAGAPTRLQLALADDQVSDERLAELVAEWDAHLGSLDAHVADHARFELRRYTQIVEGLRPAGHQEDASE